MIRFGTQCRYQIADPSEIAAVRRSACLLAAAIGFDESRVGQVALVVTEAATNILKFATRGEILLRSIARNEIFGIEILAIDSGPGMHDVSYHMTDGNSTAGTYGFGLGTMERLSDEFDIYSNRDNGVIILSVLWKDRIIPGDSGWEIGGICLPIASEDVSGDAWGLRVNGDECTILCSDGLGHGHAAASASHAAIKVIADNEDMSAMVLLKKAHAALHSTRGAAVAIACIDRDQAKLRFSGVGNIAVCMFTESTRRHLISHNGIVGSNLRKVQEFTESWQPNTLLIGHSDGINTRWDLDQYPGLVRAHPNLIAAVLYRDFSRGRDDVSVVVLRDRGRQL